MNLLDLMVKIGIDDQASSKISGVSSSIKDNLGTAAKVGAAAFAAVSAAAVAAANAIVDAANATADYGDKVDKASQKMGLSAEAYQEWDAVLQHSGTSIDAMNRGMVTLQKNAVNNAEAFEQLGISQEDIANMSTEELFEATITGLQGMEQGAERTALAAELLGGSAKELGPLLNTSAEETKAMRERVHELGGVMSDEAVKASAAYKDSMQDLQTAVMGVRNSIMTEFLPGITTVMDGLQEVFAGNSAEGVAIIQQGVSDCISVLTTSMPQFLSKGAEIIGALAQAFLQNFPSVLSAFVGGITELINYIAGHTDEILAVAGEFFMTLVTASVEMMPQLLGSIANLLASLLNSILENLPEMLSAGLQLIGQLLIAIVNSAGQILSAFSSVIDGGLSAVLSFLGDFLSAGGELVMSIVDGIGNFIGDIADTVGQGIDDALQAVQDFFWDMYNAGANIINGLIEGIRDSIGGVVSAMNDCLAEADGYLPHSPAKKGPFSGRGWTLYSGQALMEGLAQGIEENVGKVEDAMLGAASAVEGAEPSEIGIGASDGVTVAQRGGFGITINGMTVYAQDAEDFIQQLTAFASRTRMQYA